MSLGIYDVGSSTRSSTESGVVAGCRVCRLAPMTDPEDGRGPTKHSRDNAAAPPHVRCLLIPSWMYTSAPCVASRFVWRENVVNNDISFSENSSVSSCASVTVRCDGTFCSNNSQRMSLLLKLNGLINNFTRGRRFSDTVA